MSAPAEAALERLREAAALLLWDHGAVRVSPQDPFRLASGNYSPIYIDCRRVISEPVFMQLFTTAAGALLAHRGVEVDAVAGGETAGIPYAAVLARALGRPMVYVRKKPKGYGTASRVEGRIEPGARVLLVEDLITDGGSKVGFLDAVAEAGGVVREALVLFDRQQGGGAMLARRDVRLHAVTDRATALAVGRQIGLLEDEDLRSVDAYFEDPESWHRERDLTFHPP